MRFSLAVAIGLFSSLSAFAPRCEAGTVEVTIKDLAFEPADVTARTGDTVVWRNDDFVDHTATARDETFDVDLSKGKSGRLLLNKPGTFEYFCRYHPMMTGIIHVHQR
jgi:plastocyanin